MSRAEGSKGNAGGDKKLSQVAKRSRSAGVARAGIKTSEDMKNLMSNLIPDILDGDVSIAAANATCNAAGKMIKMVELELRYGKEAHPQTRTTNKLKLLN